MTDISNPAATAPAAAPAPRRPKSRAWAKLRRHPSAIIGAVLVGVFVALALLAPVLPIANPNATNWGTVRLPPSLSYPLGTDDLGRDILARMIWGARASLQAGVIAVAIAIAIGVPLGIAAGYFGGWTDAIISRCTEALLAIPFLILAIALATFLGRSLTNAMIAIGIAATPIFIRLTRAQAINVAAEDYVESARAIGLSTRVILTRYILPNTLPPILVQATLAVASAVIAEASLSFLGLGQQAPAPSWGAMLDVAKRFMAQAPWMALWPGIAIFLVVLGFNLFGDGLRDALDPRED